MSSPASVSLTLAYRVHQLNAQRRLEPFSPAERVDHERGQRRGAEIEVREATRY
jgi:hypothetical protein